MHPELQKFGNKVQALAEVRDPEAPFFLICRDSHRKDEHGAYTGGKLFRVYRDAAQLYALVSALPADQRHLYEHVGHLRRQLLAPYVDVDLLLRADLSAAAQARLLAWRSEGKLRPRVDELVAFEALPEALDRLLDGGVQGKLALAVDPSATATV